MSVGKSSPLQQLYWRELNNTRVVSFWSVHSSFSCKTLDLQCPPRFMFFCWLIHDVSFLKPSTMNLFISHSSWVAKKRWFRPGPTSDQIWKNVQYPILIRVSWVSEYEMQGQGGPDWKINIQRTLSSIGVMLEGNKWKPVSKCRKPENRYYRSLSLSTTGYFLDVGTKTQGQKK